MLENPRLQALRVLMSVDAEKSYANLSFPKNSERIMSGADRALLVQLVYGTVARQITLDYVLNLYLKKPLSSMPVPVRNILRLGAYQSLFLDRIPTRAAVDESVKLAHKFGHRGTVGLVNAVLRRVAELTEIPWPDRTTDEVEHLSIRYSHPRFLVKRYLERLGFEETEELLKLNNEPAPLSIRVNMLKTNTETVKETLAHEGIVTTKGLYVPEILYLAQAPSFEGQAFKQGHYFVQGESSALCAHFLAPQPNEVIADLCSAPGGKTTHIAELMKDRGTIYAFDVHPNRLALVRQNAKRLGLNSIKTVAQPAQDAQGTVSQVDRVLLDAPCSGFGVLRHKPDIRLNRSEERIAELALLQKELMTAAAGLVRPGGRLVYSVCTTEPEETTQIASWFLSERDDFVVAEPPAIVKQKKRDDTMGYTFMPQRDGIDGFYIASFVRAGI